MSYTLQEDANAIIFPAFASTELSDACKRFLDEGGISILVGESREEYVARKMTDERRAKETPETFTSLVGSAKALTSDLLVAVDQELGGICRMHDLVPQFPSNSALIEMSSDEVEENAYEVAKASQELGVNVFLAPIVDLLTGVNPWLEGRTYSTDPEIVGRVSAAYVRGVQRAGVAATAKHFPGFHNITGDPAIDPEAIVVDDANSYLPGFGPFNDVIASDVEMIMVGPAINKALDPSRSALRSKSVVDILKLDLRYKGIVMADDLDSKATMRGDSIEEVALDAVKAGCDFLLLADIDTQLSDVSKALVSAAETGEISREMLASSAQKMRDLANRYATD
ncbi:glycoside hydrolase family 3 protein [Ruegeria atlantica]|uniref:glycoside hydrolase family 3 protein n=1 Tax=Ruegeria atlantica TaxID=81569 RepID=UPI00147A2FE3|nr:glycoside hydrolase family 3 protein [Ruegeria atlantica]